MGLIGGLFKAVGFVVLVLVGLGAYLYFTDYAVEATITDKGSDAGGDYVVVTPELAPYDIRQEVEPEAVQFVCEGYRVTYRIQSGVTHVYDREGRLVWDSENGLNDALRTLLTRC
jgi:hypothetical protein